MDVNNNVQKINLWIIQDYNNQHIIPIDQKDSGQLKEWKDNIVMQIDDKFYARSWNENWVEIVTIHNQILNNEQYFEKY